MGKNILNRFLSTPDKTHRFDMNVSCDRKIKRNSLSALSVTLRALVFLSCTLKAYVHFFVLTTS